MRILSLAAPILAIAAAPAVAGADTDARQTVRAKLTTVVPRAATGTWLDMRFVDPANPGGKPYSLDKLVIRSGVRFDPAALPRCEASDVELLARGEAACPTDSRVQTGRIVLDTGSPLGIPRLMRLRTATFNAEGGFVSIGEAENFVMRGVVRSTVRDGTITVDYADAPGWGGPDSYSAMTTMVSGGPAIVRDGRAFLRTPRRCPRSRRWATRYTFIYHDGVRQTATTHARCRPRRGHR